MDAEAVLRGMRRGRVLYDAGYDVYAVFLGVRRPEKVPATTLLDLISRGQITTNPRTLPGPPIRFVLRG